jgi:hypothetical protein
VGIQTVKISVMPQIFPDGQLHVDGWILEKDPDLLPHGSRKLPQTPAPYGNLPVLEGENRRNELKKGGLSASIGPKDAEHPALFQFEINIVENPLPSIGVPNSLRRHCV